MSIIEGPLKVTSSHVRYRSANISVELRDMGIRLAKRNIWINSLLTQCTATFITFWRQLLPYGLTLVWHTMSWQQWASKG